MPVDNQHIIQKVNARLVVAKHEEANARSERLKVAVERAVERLAPVLDTVPDDITLFVDHITVQIDLDVLDQDQLEERIRSALAEKLRQEIHSRLTKSVTEAGAEGTFSEEQQYKKVLAFFLKKGRAPWWASPQVSTRARDYLDSLTASEWVHFMDSLFRQSPSVIKRYVKQWSGKTVFGNIRNVAKEQLGSEIIVSLLKGILAIDAANRDPERGNFKIEQRLYEIVIRDLVYNNSERLVTGHLIREWLQMSAGDPIQQSLKLNELKKYLSKQTLSGLDDSNMFGKEFLKQAMDEKNEVVGEEVHQEEDLFASDNIESIPVRNAGVVLLHNYLQLLFKRLGYLEDGAFRNEETRERAVCAIHYLASGESEFPEEELLLAKLLCDWPLDEPVNRYLDFSGYEKEECENLLLSVISHWKALKNTSAVGLRKSFLQREGILKKEEFGFTLYVEELTHDILLQRLPWSFSVVKLSWMNEMLSVHWRSS